jgi:D-alanyl-lipoteichoic acid acyltransferase DltB (MBOAT superfamily)
MRNFAFPYFSRDIAEFWRRWHISLSTWFRDYLYIPLGGSKGSMAMKVRNTMIVFLVSGFWHGANWTFIVWGAINALLFLPLILTNRNRTYLETPAKGRLFPSIGEAASITMTFAMTLFAWVFFRAPSLGDAVGYIKGILSTSILSVPWFPGIRESLVPLVMIGFFVVIEWLGRDSEYAIQDIGKSSRPVVRWALAYILCMAIFLFGGQQQDFIYFQF